MTNAGTSLINVVVPPVTGTFLAQLTVNGTIFGTAESVTFSLILSLNAGDVLTIRSVGGQSVTVPAGIGINIVRIS